MHASSFFARAMLKGYDTSPTVTEPSRRTLDQLHTPQKAKTGKHLGSGTPFVVKRHVNLSPRYGNSKQIVNKSYIQTSKSQLNSQEPDGLGF